MPEGKCIKCNVSDYSEDCVLASSSSGAFFCKDCVTDIEEKKQERPPIISKQS